MLHIVNKSPYQNHTLASCLRCVKSGHALLLIEDGVYGAVQGSSHAEALQAAPGLKVYALKPDVDARGMGERVASHITLVDYAGFVGLVAEHPASNSWL